MIKMTIEQIHQKFLGKKVNLQFENVNISGDMSFAGISPIAKELGSNYYTITIGRTPVRVPFDKIDKVKVTLFEDFVTPPIFS
jgi:ribosome maturation factor RimP